MTLRYDDQTTDEVGLRGGSLSPGRTDSIDGARTGDVAFAGCGDPRVPSYPRASQSRDRPSEVVSAGKTDELDRTSTSASHRVLVW